MVNVVPIQDLMSFSKIGNEFQCKIKGQNLEGLEKILGLVNSNYCPVENANFFEFGSAHYNLSTYTVRSAKHSHFFGLGTNLKYNCFDAYVEKSDFDVLRNLMDAFNKAEKITSKTTGVTYAKYDDPIWKDAEIKFSNLDKKKDFSDNFVRIRNEEYYKKFFGFYDGVDLDKLKEEIKSFSISDYSKILNEIDNSENPVIFSQSVLNCPNLSFEFPFWKIQKGFNIHRGSIRELGEIIRFKFDRKFIFTDGRIFDDKDLFLEKFKKRFDLENKNLNLSHTGSEYFISWN